MELVRKEGQENQPEETKLAGFSGGVPSESLASDERLKIAIVGDFKMGKSTLAATAPTPAVVFDFDDRAESLAGKPGLYIYRKATMTDVETALNIAQGNAYQKKPNLNPKTWIFDSVTFMNKAMEADLSKISPEFFRKIKVGNKTTVTIRQSWDVINGIQRYMEYLIAEFSLLGNIIFVFHEKNEKDYTKSTPQETKYTGEITIDPQYLAKSLSLFNEVFRIYVDYDGKFKVQVKQEQKFAASTTMLIGEKGGIEEPDIQKMLQKHRAALAAGKK